MSEQNVERSLGRIEGIQSQILAELQSFKADFATHVKENVENFHRIDTEFVEDDRARNQHLNEQDIKIDALLKAKAVVEGQLTLGQKIFYLAGSFAVFAWAVFETFYNHR
jgi:hypothetical protein